MWSCQAYQHQMFLLCVGESVCVCGGGTFKKAKHLDQCSGNTGNQRLMITYHTCDVSVNMGEKTGFLLCD